jgi:hypothetical protein
MIFDYYGANKVVLSYPTSMFSACPSNQVSCRFACVLEVPVQCKSLPAMPRALKYGTPCSLQVSHQLSAYSNVLSAETNTFRAEIGIKRWAAETVVRMLGIFERSLPWLKAYKGCATGKLDLTWLIDTDHGMVYASLLRQRKQGDYQEVYRTFQAFSLFCKYLSVTWPQLGVDKDAALRASNVCKGMMAQVYPYVDSSRKQRREVVTHSTWGHIP